MPRAARVGDQTRGWRRLFGCLKIPVTGKIAGPGISTVHIENTPASVKGDLGSPAGDTVSQGSSNVVLAGKPAARVGDKMSNGGYIVGGSATVDIGG